jgi:predicted aspartyl protease
MPLAEAGFCNPAIPEDKRADILVTIGPTLAVTVGHLDSKAANPALAKDQASELVNALVDTGALESCIDDALAKKIGLPVIDRQICSGVNGESSHDVYLALIDIPTLSFMQYGRFMGVHLTAGGQPHQVLLGRTLLRTMVLIYDGVHGTVTIAR